MRELFFFRNRKRSFNVTYSLNTGQPSHVLAMRLMAVVKLSTCKETLASHPCHLMFHHQRACQTLFSSIYLPFCPSELATDLTLAAAAA